MNKLFSKARLVSTAVLSISVLAASLLVSAPAAESVNCPQLKANDRFKVTGFPAVYLVNPDGKRLYFPNAEVYFTWFSDFSGITTIDSACVDNYPSGGGLNYRPGSRLVKTTVSPSVFLIEPHNVKRRIANEEIAKALYGSKWNTLVRYVTDAQDSNMEVGPDVKVPTLLDGANGAIVVVEDVGFPTHYFVDKGTLRKIVGTLPNQLSGDVRILSASLFQTASMSSQAITPEEILSDPSQGGIVVGGKTIVPQNPVQSTVPTETTTPVNPQTLETGGNFVDVASCKQIGKDIEIKRVASDTPYKLLSSCRDAGYGLREYTMSCGSSTRYYVSWKPCSSAPVQSNEQADVITQLTIIENKSGITRLTDTKSYGSGAGYPWNPSETTVDASAENLDINVINKTVANLTYGFAWVDNAGSRPEFTDLGAKTLSKMASFSSYPSGKLNITDYYRGKWVLVYAFVRNNDGISGVPGMSVEVDDIAVVRVYIPAKTNVPVVTGPNLSLVPSFVSPTAGQILTNFPRTAELSFTRLSNAHSYDVEIYCDYCGSSKWSSGPYKFSTMQPSSGYAKVTTYALAGDNEFRARVRAVYVDTVTGEYVYGTWSDYRYFSFKTAPAVTVTETKTVTLTELNALNPKTINFEDATGEVITKYTSAYGVTIWSNKGTAIFTSTYNRGGAATASGEYSLFNNATYPNTSANDPLILGFNTPVKAFGFYLGNGDKYGQQVDATITVYGEFNTVLATLKKSNVSYPATTFFGVSSNKLIYRVTIDYGNTSLGEEIDDLMLVR